MRPRNFFVQHITKQKVEHERFRVSFELFNLQITCKEVSVTINMFFLLFSNLMNSGEVPNIFTIEEKMELCEKMRQLDRQRDKSIQTDGSPVALFNFFVQVVKEQLHLVLTMSPIGDSFRNRIRKFPALVNCCTIDWFQVRIVKNGRIIVFTKLTNLETGDASPRSTIALLVWHICTPILFTAGMQCLLHSICLCNLLW